MNSDQYLKSLQAQLKGFSAEDRAQVIEEIAAHIEAGENDPELGQDAAGRARRLEKELGSPDELGQRLQQVHRPGRWLDFLMVTLPSILVFPLLPLLALLIIGQTGQTLIQSGQTGSLIWVSMRLGIIIETGLVLINRWRGSAGVMLHWLASALLSIIGVLLSNIRWPWMSADQAITGSMGVPETVFWLTALALLLIWLVRMMLAQRSEPLLITLAVLPFLFGSANYVAGLATLHAQIER